MVMSEKLGLPEKMLCILSRCYISKNFVLRLYSGLPKKDSFTFILDVEIKDFFALTSLFLSVCIFVSFFSHCHVHIVIKQSIEEVFRSCFEWIQKTLPETSVRCN